MKWCRSKKKKPKLFKKNNRSSSKPCVRLSTLRGHVAQHHRLLALLEEMDGFSTRQKNHELALALLKDVVAKEQLEINKFRLRQSGFGLVFMCSMVWLTLLNLRFPELVGTQDDLYVCNGTSFDQKLMWNFFSLVLVVTAVHETFNMIFIDTQQWHSVRNGLKRVPLLYSGLSYVPSVLNVFFLMGFFVFLIDSNFSGYYRVKTLSMDFCHNATELNQRCKEVLDFTVGRDLHLRQLMPLVDQLLAKAQQCTGSLTVCRQTFVNSIKNTMELEQQLGVMEELYLHCIAGFHRIHKVYHPDMRTAFQDFWSYLLSMMLMPLYVTVKVFFYCRHQLKKQQQRLYTSLYKRHLYLMQDDPLFQAQLSTVHPITSNVFIVTVTGSASDCTALGDGIDDIGEMIYIQSKSARQHRLLFRFRLTWDVVRNNMTHWKGILRYHADLKANRAVLPFVLAPGSHHFKVAPGRKKARSSATSTRTIHKSLCQFESVSKTQSSKALQWLVLNKTYCYDESLETALVDPRNVFKIYNSSGGWFYVCFTASLVAMYIDKQQPIHHLIQSVLDKLRIVKVRGETGIVVCKGEARHSNRVDSGCFLKIKSPTHKVRIWAGLFSESNGDNKQPPLYRFERVTDGVRKKGI